MKNNKGIKFVFLILAIMSLSIIIASIPATFGMANQSNGVVSSYMHEDKKIIEDDFYKSKAFDEATIRPLVFQLTKSVQSTEGLDEETKKGFEEEIETVKRDLSDYKNMKFMVINNETREYYTNTENKDKNEFLKKNKGYYFLQIKSKDYYTEYTKTINDKVYENTNVNDNIGDLVQVGDCEIYISIPYKLVGGDNIYWNNSDFNRDVQKFKVLALLDIVSLIVFVISVVIFKKIKVNLLDKDSKLMNLYNKIPIEIVLGLLLPVIYIYIISFSIYWFDFELLAVNSMATFILIFMAYIIIKQIKNMDKGSGLVKIIIGLWIICLLLNVLVLLLGINIMAIFILTIFTLIIIAYLIIKHMESMDKASDLIKLSITVRLIKLLSKGICQLRKSTKKIPLIKRIIYLLIICVGINFVALFGLYMYARDYWGWYSSPSWVIFIGAIFTIILTLFAYYIIKKLVYLNEIMEGAKRIKEGELDYKIEIKGNDNFTILAEDINNIGEGLDNSIENQLRSERMKSELITNVSHDLKTPLTSIINYVELIKKEDNIEPNHVKDYVNVLDAKAKRLKVLIEDLFEASKASSGTMELNIEKIDLNQLVRQSIGEIEEKISASKLDIRLSLPEEKVFIKADGKRLYRVLENVLSNVVKYSLENTRVYIDLIVENDKVKLTTKNISSYELNFNPEEIMERFKRGDEARNTEGSGLGLAIARDLVRIQGGDFNIEIDGDLFKSIIEFNIEK